MLGNVHIRVPGQGFLPVELWQAVGKGGKLGAFFLRQHLAAEGGHVVAAVFVLPRLGRYRQPHIGKAGLVVEELAHGPQELLHAVAVKEQAAGLPTFVDKEQLRPAAAREAQDLIGKDPEGQGDEAKGLPLLVRSRSPLKLMMPFFASKR